MPHSVSHFTLSTPRMLIKKASSLKFIPYPCRHPSHSLCPRLHSTPLEKGVTFNEQHPPLHCIGGGGKNPLTPPFMGEHKWSEWGREEEREGGRGTMLIISKRRTAIESSPSIIDLAAAGDVDSKSRSPSPLPLAARHI